MPYLQLRLVSHLIFIAYFKNEKRDSSGEDPSKFGLDDLIGLSNDSTIIRVNA